MQEMADWLEKLGMSEYAERFAENRIDLSVLPDLTDQDLEKLGVVLGDRRKMLRAIGELLVCLPPAPPQAVPLAPPAPQTQDTAERRQVTVMFCDLVGSTALSARIDPEDLREVISAYQKCVAETVQRFGGFVAKYMGDGVLVYFGYPQAHEDDAERAVRAGLELIAAVTGLKTPCSAANPCRHRDRARRRRRPDRIGRGAGARHRRRDAEPGGSPAGDRRAEHGGHRRGHAKASRQSVRAAGPRAKGPQGYRRAGAGLGGAAGEFGGRPLRGAARDSGLTALVGREEELELLLRRWSRAKTGEGQVVLLSGEAGIGKSRLTAALLERLASEPHTRLRYFCSPQHTDSAFYPIISQMERAAGMAHDDTAASKARQARCGAGADLDLHRMRRCLPRCCRCRMMDGIPPSI